MARWAVDERSGRRGRRPLRAAARPDCVPRSLTGEGRGVGNGENTATGGVFDFIFGTSRTPSPTGRLRQREVSDNTASGRGWNPAPTGGWRNTVGSAVTVTAGRRGRRPLRGFACLTVVRKKNAASGRHFSLCVLVYITIAFLGQMSWQVPQAMHLSSSRVQVLAARSTARAPAGHFLAQSVQ